jgi:radical SAM enzyme (TIGR01210 family)
MVEAVAIGLAALESVPSTLWISSFNFLDQREVPLQVRRRILQLVAATECEVVFSESHPSTVTREAVADCIGSLKGKRFVLELGVETTSDFVRRWGFGKDFGTEVVRRAVAEATSAGASCCFNIMVGMPLLSEREAIQEAITSVVEAFEMGAESVVLFPCRIKEHTLLWALHQAGHAEPTSLLALAAVISAIDQSLWPRISLAWVTPKMHPGYAPALEPPVPHSNHAAVNSALAKFDAAGDGAALVALLDDPTYKRWLERANPTTPLPDRMLAAFATVSDVLLGSDWWRDNGAAVETELRREWAASPSGRLQNFGEERRGTEDQC